MSERIELNPDWQWAKDFQIAQGVQVGDTIYVSGQVSFDREGNIVGEEDMQAQAKQIFKNIGVVLAEAGATLDNVVKVLAFLTDMSRYDDYAAARAKAFPNITPASTTVATPSLVNPNLLIEVEAVAMI